MVLKLSSKEIKGPERHKDIGRLAKSDEDDLYLSKVTSWYRFQPWNQKKSCSECLKVKEGALGIGAMERWSIEQ